MQFLILNEEFLVSASHQLALITSLPFLHTARRYYRLNGLVRPPDWRRYSGNRAPDAGKLVKLDHLEEVKVVTRFPSVNLRKDHYRYVSKVNFNVTYCVNGTQPFRGRPKVPLNGRPSLIRHSVSPAFVFFISNFVQSENNCATLKKVVTNEKLLTVDLLAHASMKNAASSDK